MFPTGTAPATVSREEDEDGSATPFVREFDSAAAAASASAALEVRTASKDAPTIPGSSSPGALSMTSDATETANLRAAAGSGARPRRRRSAVVTALVSVCSVSAANPVCACMTFPAKRYPPLLNRCRCTGRSARSHASGGGGVRRRSAAEVRSRPVEVAFDVSAPRADAPSSAAAAAASLESVRCAFVTAPRAVAAKASPRAGKSVAAAGGTMRTTASYPSSLERYICAYLRRCLRSHPNHPTSTGSVGSRCARPERRGACATRASSTHGASSSYVTAGGSGGNSSRTRPPTVGLSVVPGSGPVARARTPARDRDREGAPTAGSSRSVDPAGSRAWTARRAPAPFAPPRSRPRRGAERADRAATRASWRRRWRVGARGALDARASRRVASTDHRVRWRQLASSRRGGARRARPRGARPLGRPREARGRRSDVARWTSTSRRVECAGGGVAATCAAPARASGRES